ncbi:MAG: hypothetical protein ABI742_12865 [Gemmatimonadota bacterium]
MTKRRNKVPAEPGNEGSSPIEHADGTTARPETPSLEGREPLPAEITGRASGTDESLIDLFDNASAEHLKDGFQGGSEDDERVDDGEDMNGVTPVKPVDPDGTRD